MDSAISLPRRSPPINRFLSPFPSLSSAPASTAAVELAEDDVCFSADFSEPARHHRRAAAAANSFDRFCNLNAGILAILPPAGSSKGIAVPGKGRKVLLALPHPATAGREREREREYSQSVLNGGRFPRSEPVMVPQACVNQRTRRSSGVENGFGHDEEDMGYGEEEEMMPPHEMTAWGSRRIPCCSVLEGAGRTLKGRDLRQVRNAIWRQTGFLDVVE